MSEKNKEEKNSQVPATTLPPDVKKAGVLRKLKTMKKKYFVLRMESESGPARLEYYDSEKKYRAGVLPKRSIIIKKCFNINRKVDAKQKLAIALYTKDDCFSVVAESEQALDEWLKAMLELQLDTTAVNGSTILKPKFEHVWQVSVGEKSIACSHNMKGLYRLCLTNTSLTLVKMEQSDNPECLEFPLMSIRRCGHSNNYFFFELGRSSVTGAGELWLETEDVVIAQNMHEVTLHAMKTCREHEDIGPHRPRSSSNTETSRPIATRRPVAIVNAQPSAFSSIRNRCDSMPSRPRTISEGQECNTRSYSNHPLDCLRAHMSYSQSVSYSPPGMPNPLSPSSDSAGSSLSIEDHDGLASDFSHVRYSHSVPAESAIPTEPPIKEEQTDGYMTMSINANNSADDGGYMHMGPLNNQTSFPEKSLYLNLSDTVHSSTSQGSDYMDMTSPISLPGDYVPMSPVGSEIAKTTLETVQNSWNNNNSKKLVEGYLYMGPTSTSNTASSAQSSNEGYLDMAPLSSSLPKTHSVLSCNTDIFNLKDSSCGVSDSSVASSPGAGKAQVYQLDKVKSLLTQTEDTSEDYIRPVRAYSMGSRPQIKKTHLSVHNDGLRIRAFSVGSQAAASRNKILNSADQELGSLKSINVRAGAKSSSAPLLHNRPPRMQSSGSRGDVGGDLMEIDYNKNRSYTMSLNDKDFTIEPVGRSRSGSCSSSSTVLGFSEKLDRRGKMIYERDKNSKHLISKSKSMHNNTEALNDYLPMSPSVCSPITVPFTSTNTQGKPSQESQAIHPAGDYVSLNPSAKYPCISSIKSVSSAPRESSPVPGTSVPIWKPNIACDASPIASKEINNTVKNELVSNCKITNNTYAANQVAESGTDYVCMNFVKSDEPASGRVELSNPTDNVEITAGNSVEQSHQPPSGSGDQNTEPKQMPPCPQGEESRIPVNSTTSSATLNHTASTSTHSAPNSRPASICEDLWLNYASLVLPSSSEDDTTSIIPVHRVRQIAAIDTKKVPLTYAQIDFSAPKPMPDSIKEGLSHL